MSDSVITEQDRRNTAICLACPVCRRARRKQRGLAYLLVKYVERGLCPKCAAYEKVYGRKAHDLQPGADDDHRSRGTDSAV